MRMSLRFTQGKLRRFGANGWHRVEAGVHLRVIQLYLGHASPETTAIYTHLTSVTETQASEKINEMLVGLWR